MKAYELNITPVSSNLFTFCKDTKTLVAEISDLEANCGRAWLTRLYNDACDIGFAIRSEKTGKVIRFSLSNEEKDREGDLVAFHFSPVETNSGVREVVIFND